VWRFDLGRHPKHALRKQTLQKLLNKKKHNVESAFTACTAGISLLETVIDAADFAAQMARSLLSTARSSFDEFQNARKCGEMLYDLVKSISWGRTCVHPYIRGGMAAH
jgi:UDP-N-acetylmuramoylalanine-D-glutamate ligase